MSGKCVGFSCNNFLEDYKCHSCAFATSFLVDLNRHQQNNNCASTSQFFQTEYSIIDDCNDLKCEVKTENVSLDFDQYEEYIEGNSVIMSKEEWEDSQKLEEEKKNDGEEIAIIEHIGGSHHSPGHSDQMFKTCNHPTKSECDHCDDETIRDESSEEHRSSNDTAEDQPAESECLQCYKCDYRTKDKTGFKHHIYYMHPKPSEDSFECNMCKSQFKSKPNLQRHIINKHMNPKPIKWLKCDKCKFKSRRKFNLENHIIAKHTSADEIKWCKCKQCEYRTKWKHYMSKHVAAVHRKVVEVEWYKCDHCKYQNRKEGNLKQHVFQVHTGSNVKKWFKCHQCTYEGNSIADFKKHLDACKPRNYK